jgi:hypothetical protein
MKREHYSPVLEKLLTAFAPDLGTTPSITLRAGNALNDRSAPEPYDPVLDEISDDYMNNYSWGVSHLDPASWRHYLPFLFEYALRDDGAGSLAADALLQSLRPPDRNPPRLASLTSEQEAAVVAALEAIAFTDGSVDSEDARQVLEEWWIPGALYRPAKQ